MTEHTKRSELRAKAAMKRLLSWMDISGRSAVVLTKPSSVEWITGGISQPVDRSAYFSDIWAVVTSERSTLITSNVESSRVWNEAYPRSHGFSEVITVPWYELNTRAQVAAEIVGAYPSALGVDGESMDFGVDISDDLIALRLALSNPELEELKLLGLDATVAVEDGLKTWRPGESDWSLQARVSYGLEISGARPVVIIVGGDERVEQYRHPLAMGAPMSRMAMVVVVAERRGLHVATTRFASAGTITLKTRRLFETVRRIESDILRTSLPGKTYGEVLSAMDLAYEREGVPNGWRGHYQGGPIGFAQREFEIAPNQRNSRWFSQSMEVGHAIAWNPSLEGGAKVEDTYVITESGPDLITKSPSWPSSQGWEADSLCANVLEV